MVSVAAQSPARRRAVELGLDVGERLFVIALFALLAFNILRAVGHGASWLNGLQLVAEGIVVVLIQLRRPAHEVSLAPVDWALTLGATVGPLLMRPAPAVAAVGPPALAGMMMMGGLALQIVAKLALGRSFGLGPANRGLVVAGPYRLVRHPVYAAYLIGQAGFVLLNPTARNFGLYAAGLVLQVLRIRAEERLLAGDPAFAAFCGRSRYRLVPGLW